MQDPAALLRQLIDADRLPTLPTIALQMLTMHHRGRLDVTKMASLIRLDPALMARTHQLISTECGAASGGNGDEASPARATANAGAAATTANIPGDAAEDADTDNSRPCMNLKTSLLLLGARRAERLVEGLYCDDHLRPAPPDVLRFPYAHFWRRAIVGAVAAQTLVKNHTNCDPQTGWIAGLMQDIGQLALAEHLGERYLRDVMQHAETHAHVAAEEQRAFGITHAQVSAALLRHWHFPEDIVRAAELHDVAPTGHDTDAELRAAVYLSGFAASAFIRHESRSASARFALQAEHLLPIGAAQARRLLQDIDLAARQYDALFTMDTTSVKKLRAFVPCMHESPREIACDTANEPSAPIDPLTGLPDRGAFEARLSELMGMARATDHALGVVLLEPDWSADTARADLEQRERIVHAVADFLRAVDEPSTEPGRLGPETFAFACPDMNLLESSKFADRLRLQCTASWPEHLPRVTIRAGVAAREPAGHPSLSQIHILLRCASEAARAAESAGGDCVRAFRPRVAA